MHGILGVRSKGGFGLLRGWDKIWRNVPEGLSASLSREERKDFLFEGTPCIQNLHI